jgi:hypothetical protein
MIFDRHLADIKWHPHIAQAYESHDQLQNNLQIHSYLFQFKDQFVGGQTANTHARNTIATVQAQINANIQTYRGAHATLLSLGLLLGKVGWQGKLQPLGDSSV